jgi:hypothetical protein
MAVTNKFTVTLSFAQMLEVMDQLSEADTLKVLKHIRKKKRSAVVDDMIAIFSKVKMSEKELNSIVEDVRKERYEKRKGLK